MAVHLLEEVGEEGVHLQEEEVVVEDPVPQDRAGEEEGVVGLLQP